MTRLLIVQPYVPSYRVPFFRSLREGLGDVGVEMRLAAGSPNASARMRRDDSSAAEADYSLEESRYRVGSRTAIVRRLGKGVSSWGPDLVIVEQAIKNVEAYPLIARSAFHSGPSVAMWGQGRSYSTEQSPPEAALKQWLTRRCDWFFSYTDGGAAYVVEHGFPAARVTVVNNTIDTTTLASDLDSVTSAEVAEFRRALRLQDGPVGLFLGGVDSHKGISFLLEAADRMAQLHPGFTLLVGGSGTQEGDVRRAQETGRPVRLLGRIDGFAKALALRSAVVVLVPEWIGLVAVDALVAGVPIVTTRHGSHSPEADYLEDGVTALFSEHDPAAYAECVARLLADPDALERMQRACRATAKDLSLDSMVRRFVGGVASWRRSVEIRSGGCAS